MLDENGQPKRRKVDLYSFDIESLIAEESDTKQRVYLIVLNNLNKSLVANTETILSVSQKLDTHLTNFETYTKDKDELLNKGRGMWKVAAWVLGVAQLVAGAGWMTIRGEMNRMHETDVRIEKAVNELREFQK
jgi:hypothetical protein